MTDNFDALAQDIVHQLGGAATDAQRVRLMKRGVDSRFALGCGKAAVQAQAKTLLRSEPTESLRTLAAALWATEFHETRQLALRILPPGATTADAIEALAAAIGTWDLADDLARYVICRMPVSTRDQIIARLVEREALYCRRAGFAGIACTMIHAHESVDADRLAQFCRAIASGSKDDRRHVKKAVSWALREIGKANIELLETALDTAAELADGTRHQAWVARDALRELTQLTTVTERRRLLKQSAITARSTRD